MSTRSTPIELLRILIISLLCICPLLSHAITLPDGRTKVCVIEGQVIPESFNGNIPFVGLTTMTPPHITWNPQELNNEAQQAFTLGGVRGRIVEIEFTAFHECAHARLTSDEVGANCEAYLQMRALGELVPGDDQFPAPFHAVVPAFSPVVSAFSPSGSPSPVTSSKFRTKEPRTRLTRLRFPHGKNLLVGYAEPFDRIDLTLAKPRSGGMVSWRYWNGHSWAPLTLASDGTSGLARSGAVVLTPPSDWQPQSVNGSHSKFWIQLEINGASEAPTIATIKGDSWMNAAEHMRGWNPRSCQTTLITLAYKQTQYCAWSARYFVPVRELV
jgi:hypothetical protein